MKYCVSCNKEIPNRNKYCNNSCQSDFSYKSYIKVWLHGGKNGSRGLVAKNLSGHIIRYLREKSEGKCTICGWNEENKITGRVPLEIDHIDGDSDNNLLDNLRLICPNCHSLTATYRNLNNGNGRKWRKAKYLKV